MNIPTMYHLIVPGIPQPKERPRVVRKRGGGVIAYTPHKTASYEAKVRFHAAQVRMGPIAGEVCMSFHIYLPDKRRRDADNIIKTVKDALNGVAYADDSQATEGHWSTQLDREKPRVEVWIGPRSMRTLIQEVP